MTPRVVAVVVLVLALGLGSAGSRAAPDLPDGEEILRHLEQDYLASKDLEAHLTGFVATADQRFPVDVKASVVVSPELFRLDFEEPQALADSFILINGGKLYNYSFIANTVLVSDARRANASALGNLDITALTRFGKLVPTDKVKLARTTLEKTPSGEAFAFTVDALPGANLFYSRARVWVLAESYRPYRFQVMNPDGSVRVDLTVKDWRYNAKLDLKRLTTLPKGAEVIRR